MLCCFVLQGLSSFLTRSPLTPPSQLLGQGLEGCRVGEVSADDGEDRG